MIPHLRRYHNIPATIFLGLYPGEIKTPIQKCLQQLYSHLPKTRNNWNVHHGWMNKLIVIYWYKGILLSNKRKLTMMHATKWMNLNSIILNKRSQIQKLPLLWFNLGGHSGKGEAAKTEIRSVVSRGWKSGKRVEYKGTWGNLLEG